PDMHIGPLWKPQAEPQLFARPDRVTLFAEAGGLPAPRTLLIKNGGGGQLVGVKASLESPVPWLSVSGDPTSLTLEVKRQGLVTGANRATITISATGVASLSVPVLVNADESFPPPP